MEVYKSNDGTEVAVIAATWEINPKVTFASLSPEFKSNPVRAWRNFGSVVGSGGGSPALKDPRTMELHVNVRRADPWDYVRERFYDELRGKRLARYYIHLDLAKNKDAAGIACVHREPSGVMVVDFMHAHRAKPGSNIQFAELREKYIYALRERGFKIQLVTFDQWNSEESRQILEGMGFETDQVSADKTSAPYDTLIELILNDRLDYYQHDVFMREMSRLQTNGLKYDHLKNGCFVGETRIPLLDGTFPTMAELAGKEVLLWASQPDGCVTPARARGRMTGMTTELVDVVLDSGAVERCTPDHLWRQWDGSYIPAKELQFRQRLMPLHWGFVKGGYLRLLDKARRGSVAQSLAHQIVYSHFHGEVPDGCIVHHLDHNKLNNHPDNLEARARGEHCRYHTAFRHRTDPAWRLRLYEGARQFNESPEGQAKHAAAIRRTTEARVAARRYNHQVWAVIPVHLPEPLPVYDLEVDEHHNFALSSGVFVHNSKDVSDAVACACFAAIQYELENPVERGTVRVKRATRHGRFNPRYEKTVW